MAYIDNPNRTRKVGFGYYFLKKQKTSTEILGYNPFVEAGKENKFRHRGCSVLRGLKIES